VNLDLQSNMRFGDVDAFMIFLGDHAMAHQQYQAAMFAKKSVQVPGFDMAELGNPKEWALAHYEIHRAINSVLKLPEPVDLLAFDLENEVSYYDWLENHQLLHDTTDSLLGLK
jgi:hypothetical protein